MTEAADSTLSRLERELGSVWGDDAPLLWARLSKEPAVRWGSAVWITSTDAVQEGMRQADLFSSRSED